MRTFDPRTAQQISLVDGVSIRTAFRRRNGSIPAGARPGRPPGPGVDVYEPLLREYVSGLPLVDHDARKIAKKLSVCVRKVRENLALLRSEWEDSVKTRPRTT